MRARNWLVWIGYAGFAAGALVVSLYLTFPAEAVGQRLAHELQRRTRGNVSVGFDDVSLYRLSGIEARGVKVRTAEQGKPPVEVQLDVVRARLRILPLLWLSRSIDAEVQLGDGIIEARITPAADHELDAQLAIEALNLSSPPVLPALLGMPLRGMIQGALEAAWRKDVKSSAGTTKLSWKGATLGPGTIEVAMMPGAPKTPFSIPSTSLGDVELELKLAGERLQVASFKQTGGDLQLEVSGRVTVKPRIETSALDMCIALRAMPAFLDKNPKVKTALQLAEVQLRKDARGYLNVSLGGTLARPRLKRGVCSGKS